MIMSVKYQDAIIQGQDAERHNTIKTALNNGMPKEEIIKFLNISKQEIDEVAKELRQPTES